MTGSSLLLACPARGAMVVTIGEEEILYYPRIKGASPDRSEARNCAGGRRAYAQHGSATCEPLSEVMRSSGSTLRPTNRVSRSNFALALHPGKAVRRWPVDSTGRDVAGGIIFGLHDPMLENAASIRGDGPFLVRNLDSTWPRRDYVSVTGDRSRRLP